MSIDLVVVPSSRGIDEIRVYFEDIAPGKGYVTMICYGSAWTAWFGGMGSYTIRQFVSNVGLDYLSNKMNDYGHMKQTQKSVGYLVKVVKNVQSYLNSEEIA